MNYIDDIRRGYEEAVINSSAAVYNTNLAYRPEFIKKQILYCIRNTAMRMSAGF